jgi:glycosyltransferase involved in cell wall biosynthesis
VGLRDNSQRVDGFSSVKYMKLFPCKILKTIKFHLTMLFSLWSTDADIVIFGTSSVHLLPFCYFFNHFKKKRFLVLDIRTVPVDLKNGWNKNFQIWRYQFSLKLANRFCDAVTVITPMLLQTVRPYLNRISKKIGVWSSGVCFEYFHSMRKDLGLEDKKVLFYHGILSPNRGIQNAIKALSLLKDKMSDLVFLLVGEGDGRQEIQSLAKKLGISDRLIIFGKVSYHEIAKFVRIADAGILPFPNISCWEVSSPIKLMEYLAMKIPVIATDIHAHRYVLEMTGGGFLIPNNNPETIADSIIQVLDNGQEIFKKIPPKKNIEEIISWNAQAKKLELFLKDLIKDQKKGNYKHDQII